MPKRSSASRGTASSKWLNPLPLACRAILLILALVPPCVGTAQTLLTFKELNKAPALVGTVFGGAATRRSIVVRDWKDYHLYSFEANTWEKIQFPPGQLHKLKNQGAIACAYLPTFGKLITLTAELEVVDLVKLSLEYYPVEGAAPVASGTAVRDEKVYLLGNSLVVNLDDEARKKIPQPGPRQIWPPTTRFIVPTRQFFTFDPATLRYEELDTLPGYHFRLGAFAGDQLYAIGPSNIDAPATDVIRYDPKVNRWDSVTQLPYQVGTVVSAGNMLIMMGLHRHEGFLVTLDITSGQQRFYRTNVPWTHGLAFVRDNRLYYLAGMKENPKIRDVFFRHPRWLDRNMYVLDLGDWAR